MRLARLLQSLSYRAYDGHGRLKYLLGRPNDATAWANAERSLGRDNVNTALRLVCQAFEIPESQMYCLRPDDDLLEIYRSKVGPRCWDGFEFERLALDLDQLPGPRLPVQAVASLKTIGDLARLVADRARTGP